MPSKFGDQPRFAWSEIENLIQTNNNRGVKDGVSQVYHFCKESPSPLSLSFCEFKTYTRKILVMVNLVLLQSFVYIHSDWLRCQIWNLVEHFLSFESTGHFTIRSLSIKTNWNCHSVEIATYLVFHVRSIFLPKLTATATWTAYTPNMYENIIYYWSILRRKPSWNKFYRTHKYNTYFYTFLFRWI